MKPYIGNYLVYYKWYNKILFYLFSDRYKFIRKIKGGTWYRMRTGLQMGDIWGRRQFKSCQAFLVETEIYPLV